MLKVGLVVSVCLFSLISCSHVKSICERTRLPGGLLRQNLVNVVYTMEDSCDMCVQQAARLPRLKRYLEKKGIKTHFIIGVNKETDRLSGLVPHIQVNNRQIWRALGHKSNHFYVIDRCGRMVFEIINPWSNLNLTFVRSAIVTTQFSHRCGMCPQDYNHVPQKEEIIEYPEHTESSEHIPEEVFPFKIVVKLRHRHKGDHRIYNHAVTIPELPKYHGHLPENEHSLNGNNRRRHSQSFEKEEPERSEIHESKKLIEDSSGTENSDSSLELRNENSTTSITKEERTSNQLLHEKLPQVDTKNSSSQKYIETNIKTVAEEQQTPQNWNDKKEEILKNSEDDPPDSFEKEKFDQKEHLKRHYKHILHWVSFTNDYD